MSGSSQIITLGKKERNFNCNNSVQVNPWRVVGFSADICLAQSSLRKSFYIAFVISTIFEKLVTIIRYTLLKFNWKNSETTH